MLRKDLDLMRFRAEIFFAPARESADAKVMQGYPRVLAQRPQVCENEAIAALIALTLADTHLHAVAKAVPLETRTRRWNRVSAA